MHNIEPTPVHSDPDNSHWDQKHMEDPVLWFALAAGLVDAGLVEAGLGLGLQPRGPDSHSAGEAVDSAPAPGVGVAPEVAPEAGE